MLNMSKGQETQASMQDVSLEVTIYNVFASLQLCFIVKSRKKSSFSMQDACLVFARI